MRRSFVLVALAVLLVSSLVARADTFESDGVSINYIDRGQGDAVVFLHGYCGSVDQFGQMVSSLSKRYRVLAVDCRGHGKSGKPHGVEKYGEQMVSDVVRLLDHLDIAKAHIAGYSMGGMLTLRFVTDHPDRVLCAVPCGFGWPARESADALYDTLANSLEKDGDFAPLFAALTPDGAPAMTEGQIRQFNDYMAATNDVKALAAVARGFKSLHLDEAKLRSNEVPVRLIVGASDPLAADAKRMDGVMRRCDRFEIEGDHMNAFVNPEMWRLLVEFIDAHGTRKDGSAPEPKDP